MIIIIIIIIIGLNLGLNTFTAMIYTQFYLYPQFKYMNFIY